MHRRPVYVTIIGCLYILSGSGGFIYHLITPDPYDVEYIMALVIRILAVIGGILVMRGISWARWLLVAWISYHVVLSFRHSIAELMIHILILVITVLFLFNKQSTLYFRKV